MMHTGYPDLLVGWMLLVSGPVHMVFYPSDSSLLKQFLYPKTAATSIGLLVPRVPSFCTGSQHQWNGTQNWLRLQRVFHQAYQNPITSYYSLSCTESRGWEGCCLFCHRIAEDFGVTVLYHYAIHSTLDRTLHCTCCLDKNSHKTRPRIQAEEIWN